jgi:hypothetical protein
MSNNSDKPTTARQPKFLNALRDVLFESTPESNAGSPAPAERGRASETAASDAGLAAARAALQQSMNEELGPAVRELTLQTEGLREVLPDRAQRQRAALRVLALRGISVATLVVELERALSALTDQSTSFASKLETRKAALEQQRATATENYRTETAQAELAIQELRAGLEREQQRLVAAAAQRDAALTECNQHLAELSQKQRAFELAFQEACDQYRTLKQQITVESA